MHLDEKERVVAEMSDRILGNSSDDIVFEMNFKLKNGGSYAFEGLPYGSDVTVTEKGAEGYTATVGEKTGEEGKDLADTATLSEEDATFAFVNTYNTTRQSITISSGDGTWPYDGTDHWLYEYVVTYNGKNYSTTITNEASSSAASLPKLLKRVFSLNRDSNNIKAADETNSEAISLSNGDTVTITPDPDAKVRNVADSGENNNLFTYVITNSTGDDVTDLYENVETEYGDLSITKVHLVITTPSATKQYDGTALTNTEASISGLVPGDTATVVATGSQTEVGSSENTYSLTWGTADPNNYIITEDIGMLTVTPDDEEDPKDEDPKDEDSKDKDTTDKDSEKDNNEPPKTGDSTMIWLYLLLLSGSITAGLGLLIKRR